MTMRPNALKQTLAAGRQALGCWLATGSPIAAEIVGLAGYDFLIIDHEHGPGSLIGAVGQLQAVAVSPSTVLMRVPWNDPVYIKRALDTGVEGIMVPMVETAEQARAAVAACRYPPDGIRGCAASMVRASRYGLDAADYVEQVNRELCIVVQIESGRAVDNVAEIAAVEGVDVLFIGPTDLSASIGLPGRTGEAEALRLIERAESTIRAAGARMAAVPYAGMTWQEMFDRGYDMIAGASDVALLRNGALADVRAHRARRG